ncbi:hypothetical protein [Desulfopila inferna]|uniref:hypothetical protein n=1 Tax=Desulfopila inferna TaxID=468528 RepID=UPI001966B53D|nr:hypothetical protein [Desulfopila inferna]MBM9605946.1 hypothetical protein [Desulfopila inferna]
MKTTDFEIMAGFIWQQLEAFREHIVGDKGTLKQVPIFLEFATFLENNYEAFQEYLEEWHEIEGTEAERFIDELRKSEKTKDWQKENPTH